MTEDPHPSPTSAPAATPLNRRLLTSWYVFFGVVFVALVVLYCTRRLGPTSFLFTTWADRDLHRAAQLGSAPQFTGPEITGIGRTPGGFYYVVLAAVLALRTDPHFVFTASLALTALGVVTLALGALRTFGRFEAMAVLVFSGGIVTQIVANTVNIWNPGFLWLFIASSYALFVHILSTERATTLPLMVWVTALGAQIHISLYSLLVLETIAIALLLPRQRARTWGFYALALGCALAPYLYSEWQGDFANFRLLSLNEPKPLPPGWVLTGLFGWLVTAFGIDSMLVVPMPGNIGPMLVRVLATSFLFGVTVSFFATEARARRRRVVGVPPGSALARRDRIHRGLILVLVVGLVVQRLGAIHETIMTRHYLMLAPAGVLLSASALRGLVERLEGSRSRGLSRSLNALLMAWCLAAIGWNTTCWSSTRALLSFWGILTYDELAEITTFARERLHLPASAIATNTLLLGPARGGSPGATAWAPLDSSLHITFPTYLASNTRVEALSERCLVVFVRGQDDHAAFGPDDAERALATVLDGWGVAPRPIEVASRGRFAYASYAPIEGNCPRSFAHPYNRLPAELELARARARIRARAPQAIPLGHHEYGVAFGAFPHAAVAGVRLDRRGAAFVATIYGEALRGNGGTQSHMLVNPRLVYVSRETGAATEQGFPGPEVGGAQSLTAAPWHSAPILLAPGHYNVSLVTIYESSYRYGGSESRPFRQTLEPDLIVRGGVE